MEAHHHRSSTKQSHKPFKSRHATKNDIRRANRNVVERPTAPGSGARPKHQTRLDRRNQRRQEQHKRREELVGVQRLFCGRHGVPKVVSIVALGADVDPTAAAEQLFRTLGTEFVAPENNVLQLELPRFKQRLQLIPTQRSLLAVLDAARISDYLLLLVSSVEPMDDFGDLCLSALKAQGLPLVAACAQHTASLSAKERALALSTLTAQVRHHCPDTAEVFDLESSAGADKLLRHLAQTHPRSTRWRDRTAFMRIEEMSFQPDAAPPPPELLQAQASVLTPSPSNTYGTLSVTGWLRGQAPLHVNGLLHLPGQGDFQIESVTVAATGTAASSDPSLRETLIAELQPDPLAAEQTWPTDAEVAEADELVRQQQARNVELKRVPKGTSAYQAAWIVESEDEGSASGDDTDMAPASASSVSESSEVSEAEEKEEYEEINVADGDGAASVFDPLSHEQEERDYEEYLEARREAALEDQQFPDELDTPKHIAARTRFRKFRGLSSFRSSAWDPYENLPEDYARVYQFESFERTRRRILKDAAGRAAGDGATVEPASRVTVALKHVPVEAAHEYARERSSRVFYAVALLPHEHKMSVVNLQLQRHVSSEAAVVKSKDPLLVQVGFRRYVTRPIYSANTRGSANNVHKFLRFFAPGGPTVATAYLPVAFAPTPVLAFSPFATDASNPTLLATGTVEDVQPTRIVVKRIVLSGHPFKVHRRVAVVRYMFWTPEDVAWFKPIELHTKYGRRGYIKDSLGTHGYMKCLFDGPLRQQDTILMSLYKRVYPKWGTRLFSGFSSGEESAARSVTFAMDTDEFRAPMR